MARKGEKKIRRGERKIKIVKWIGREGEVKGSWEKATRRDKKGGGEKKGRIENKRRRKEKTGGDLKIREPKDLRKQQNFLVTRWY